MLIIFIILQIGRWDEKFSKAWTRFRRTTSRATANQHNKKIKEKKESLVSLLFLVLLLLQVELWVLFLVFLSSDLLFLSALFLFLSTLFPSCLMLFLRNASATDLIGLLLLIHNECFAFPHQARVNLVAHIQDC